MAAGSNSDLTCVAELNPSSSATSLIPTSVLIPSPTQRRGEGIRKIVDVFRRCQRTHQADAEDLSGERTKSTGDFNAVFFEQRSPHLGFVHTLRNLRSVQIPDAILGRYQH